MEPLRPDSPPSPSPSPPPSSGLDDTEHFRSPRSLISTAQELLIPNIPKNPSDLILIHGSREKAVDFLINSILTETISFPFVKDYVESPQILFANLQKFQPRIRRAPYTLFNYRPANHLYIPALYKGENFYIDSTNGDYYSIDALTDIFTEKARIKAYKRYCPSAYDCWRDPSYVRKIAEGFLARPTLTVQSLRETLYVVVSEPGLFKLTWAKGIISELLPNPSGKKILDMSSGWGDRMIAAISMGCDYLGYDPNLALQEGHGEIISMFGDPARHRVIYEPFEEATVPVNEFDLMLTSFPFFDLELYSSDKTQSVQKFPQFNEWMVNFLFASLRKAWLGLKDGGYFAIYSNDTPQFRISEAMNLFIEQLLPNSSWEGVIGVSGTRNKAAPTWIWRKIGSESETTRNCKRNIWHPPITRRPFYELYPELKDILVSTIVSDRLKIATTKGKDENASVIPRAPCLASLQTFETLIEEVVSQRDPKTQDSDRRIIRALFSNRWSLLPVLTIQGLDQTRDFILSTLKTWTINM